MPLEPGIYQFKFVVDGIWCFDIERDVVEDDVGNVNNVVVVREDLYYPQETETHAHVPAPTTQISTHTESTAVYEEVTKNTSALVATTSLEGVTQAVPVPDAEVAVSVGPRGVEESVGSKEKNVQREENGKQKGNQKQQNQKQNQKKQQGGEQQSKSQQKKQQKQLEREQRQLEKGPKKQQPSDKNQKQQQPSEKNQKQGQKQQTGAKKATGNSGQTANSNGKKQLQRQNSDKKNLIFAHLDSH